MRFKLYDGDGKLQYIVDGANESTIRLWLNEMIDNDVVKVIVCCNTEDRDMPGPFQIVRA